VAVLAVLALLATLSGLILSLLLLAGLLPAALLLLARLLLTAALLLAALLIALLLTGALIGVLILIHSVSFQRWIEACASMFPPTQTEITPRHGHSFPGGTFNLGASSVWRQQYRCESYRFR
jgi:hypothetical protein